MRSWYSYTACLLTAAKKLGHPVLESNFASEEKTEEPQQTQL